MTLLHQAIVAGTGKLRRLPLLVDIEWTPRRVTASTCSTVSPAAHHEEDSGDDIWRGTSAPNATGAHNFVRNLVQLMKLLHVVFVAALLCLNGCDNEPPTASTAEPSVSVHATAEPWTGEIPEVQFFNEAVLGMKGADAPPVLQSVSDDAWSPSLVWLDLEDALCYAATVKYPKKEPFEALRAAINTRYKEWELESFASDPEMGNWRIEDSGFSIGLTDDSSSFTLRYVRWAESEIVLQKLRDFADEHPEFPRSILQDGEESANESNE